MAGFVRTPFIAYVALVVAGNEVTGNGYVREPALFTYCADGETIANAATIVWPKATGNWGAIDEVEIWDDPTAGNLLGTFTVEGGSVVVAMYARARIPAAGIAGVRIPAPRPYGTLTYGIGRYATLGNVVGIGSGAGSPYGVGPYGVGPYAALTKGALLELTFDTSQHVCGAGTWAVYQEAA